MRKPTNTFILKIFFKKIYFKKLKHDIGKEKKNYFLKGKNTVLTNVTIIILEGINFITTEYNQMRIGKKRQYYKNNICLNIILTVNCLTFQLKDMG